jgi:hypothetical protein
MFYDVLTALQRRKEGTESIASQTLLLKHALGKKDPVNGGNSDVKDLDSTLPSPIPDLKKGETAVLRIDSKQSSGQLVLFKGQWIKTPMGDGQIMHLLPHEEKIIVQLTFGILYANLKQAVSWGREKSGNQLLELSSDDVLRQRWSALQSSFTMPSDVSRGIRSLVGQNDEEALTDKDDDNSNDDTNPTDTTTEDPNGSTSSSSASAGRVEGRQEGSSSSYPPSIASFPLKANLSTTGSIMSRQALKASCSSSNLPCDDDQELARTLPLVFAPPASLPHLIEAAQLTEGPDIQYCQQAFGNGEKIGTVGYLAWEGDVMDMSKELIILQDEIDRLEHEQNHYIGHVQSLRKGSVQMSTDTSGLRLAIFTRRVRHRNNLNTHVMNKLAIQAATLAASNLENGITPAVPLSLDGTILGLNGHGGNGKSVRGPTAPVKEEPLGSRTSTRLVNVSIPGRELDKNYANGQDDSNSQNTDLSSSSGATRKRGREPLPVVEILTSSRRRSQPTFLANCEQGGEELKDPKKGGGRSSSGGNAGNDEDDDEDDSEEIKDEIGSQATEEDGDTSNGARIAGGKSIGAKKKPTKKQKRK